MKKATTPISTFCAALMITACWLATSPTIMLDGGDARRGVDRAADPRPGDLLGHFGSEQVRQDQVRQPRHEVDHRHDDDQHQRNDVGEFPVVAARHAGCRDTRRDAADRDAARRIIAVRSSTFMRRDTQ